MVEVVDDKHSGITVQNMFKAWEEGLYCDVTLKCGTKQITAHKIVLASLSDYFKNLFKYHNIQSDKHFEEYELDPSIFKEDTLYQIIRYGYTGRIKIEVGFVQELLMAASFLQIRFVLTECEKFMTHNIETDNVIALVSFSNLFNLKRLLDAVCSFISKDFKDLSKSGAFWKLSTDDFKTVLHSDHLTVFEHGIPVENPELEILKLVGVYLSITSVSHKDFKASTVLELLGEIRFRDINNLDDLKSVVDLYPILNCHLLQNAINAESNTSAELLDRKFTNRRKTLRTGWKSFADGGQENHVIEKFVEAWEDGKDINDRPINFKLWIRRWYNLPVLGGISIQYRSGKLVIHGGKPNSESIFVSEHEFSLEENEVITKINVRSGWMIDSIKFFTNFGREFGPFGGPGGTEIKTESLYNDAMSYLHSFDGKVVMATGYLGITCMKFVWVSYRENQCNEIFPNSESEEDCAFLSSYDGSETD
ncbi:kelch-like protein 31 [Mytilus californianus]|uniref:kelch-like protein 31 n=1 Tax=Mytilus californianus TaxID=6549 RepID=UPI0022450AC9|nr:kelch-like protein 31 [Mytilus californianus]